MRAQHKSQAIDRDLREGMKEKRTWCRREPVGVVIVGEEEGVSRGSRRRRQRRWDDLAPAGCAGGGGMKEEAKGRECRCKCGVGGEPREWVVARLGRKIKWGWNWRLEWWICAGEWRPRVFSGGPTYLGSCRVNGRDEPTHASAHLPNGQRIAPYFHARGQKRPPALFGYLPASTSVIRHNCIAGHIVRVV